jgi:hypothetical protein
MLIPATKMRFHVGCMSKARCAQTPYAALPSLKIPQYDREDFWIE